MIQGSAARQMKKAMVDIDKAGYPMLLQLHDELGFSFTNKKDAFACAKMMEEAMPAITIPMLTDVEWGDSWGNLEKIIPSGGL
jgi:DNA polymerase I-like protein with 3'-5' exonuclease and polymerase domains